MLEYEIRLIDIFLSHHRSLYNRVSSSSYYWKQRSVWGVKVSIEGDESVVTLFFCPWYILVASPLLYNMVTAMTVRNHQILMRLWRVPYAVCYVFFFDWLTPKVRALDPSKLLQLFTSTYGITPQKTWIFSNATVRTSDRPCMQCRSRESRTVARSTQQKIHSKQSCFLSTISAL